MYAKGVTNECEDGRHIVFFDWDNYLLKKVEAECQRLIYKFRLTDIVILRTSKPNNYAGVCFQKHFWRKVSVILEWSHCDRKYIRKHDNLFAYKADIMRFTKKSDKPRPVFINVIRSPFFDGEHSNAHAIFFRDVFKVPINKEYKYDNSTKVLIHTYRLS